jgi:hypothetical protein
MAFTDRLHNRGSISTGYDIDNSLKFEADNTEYLVRTPSSDGDRKKFTISLWVKRTELGSYQTLYGAQPASGFSDNNTFQFAFTNDDKIGLGLQTFWVFQTNAVYRDTSAWYHIVVRADSTQPFAHNRIRLYVNGAANTSFSTNALSSISEDMLFGVNHTTRQQIGSLIANSWHSSCYISEVNLVDGQSHAPSYFGEFDDDTEIWKPKKYTGTYGTNGFYLDFSDSSSLGNDASSNSNNWTLNNITSADQATDTPTNNFCTLNPLYNYAYGNTITEGATKIYGAANNWGGGKATFGLTSGKWYWEIKQLANGNTFMGLQTDGEDNISSGNAQSQNTSVVFYTDGTLQYSNGSETTTSAANSIVANSIVGFALDLDSSTQTIKVYLNGSLITAFGSSGTANLSTYNIADKTVFPFVALYDRTVNMNFGGYTVSSISSAASDENGYGTFEYAPPSGYYALCTKNLAEYG